MGDQWDVRGASPVKRADRLLDGRLVYFSKTEKEVGFPPDWHRNAFSGERAPHDLHWSKISDFGYGDIKVIWEPNRFGFVYDLVRAYWRTGDERYAEAFWLLVEDWRENNSPNCGPNWKCGQEISFRVMAWCFGLYGLMGAAATRADRVARLAQMIAVSGERIEGNIGYALSQRNNHGISEAVGLWTIGLLFPELRHAERWRHKGRQFLEEESRSLIYEDGAFSQHSVNYHRLMLQDYLWALRLGDLNGQSLSDGLKGRVKKAGEFLYQLQDDETGQVPCYGQNDGALILPLNNCDYLDFRTVVQSVHYYFSGERLFDNGPWDEDLLWLFGPKALSSPVKQGQKRDLQAEEGGYYTLRNETGFVLVRCAEFKDRPAQADMLHFDLWWRGQNIAMDPGTYSYHAPDPWNNPLAHTAYHNTVTVDGRDQMDRLGKFLWLPWIKGQARPVKYSEGGQLAYWEGSQNGYARLPDPVHHERGILQLGDAGWLVVDRLTGKIRHNYRLHWLFPDLEYRFLKEEASLELDVSEPDQGKKRTRAKTQRRKGFVDVFEEENPGIVLVGFGNLVNPLEASLVRADPKSPRGWRAPYYSYREPALSLALESRGNREFFWTLFLEGDCEAQMDQDLLSIRSQTMIAQILLESDEPHNLIRSVNLKTDETADSLLF